MYIIPDYMQLNVIERVIVVICWVSVASYGADYFHFKLNVGERERPASESVDLELPLQ